MKRKGENFWKPGKEVRIPGGFVPPEEIPDKNQLTPEAILDLKQRLAKGEKLSDDELDQLAAALEQEGYTPKRQEGGLNDAYQGDPWGDEDPVEHEKGYFALKSKTHTNQEPFHDKTEADQKAADADVLHGDEVRTAEEKSLNLAEEEKKKQAKLKGYGEGKGSHGHRGKKAPLPAHFHETVRNPKKHGGLGKSGA